MARPVIGICTALERARWSVWDQQAYLLPRSYIDAVQDDPDAILDLLDGLILAGGADIDPSFYGDQAHAETRGTVPERDDFEIALSPRAARCCSTCPRATATTSTGAPPAPSTAPTTTCACTTARSSRAPRARSSTARSPTTTRPSTAWPRASRSPAGPRSTSCPRPSRRPTVASRSVSSGTPRPTSAAA